MVCVHCSLLARMMYWTDWGSKPKIEGADMSGASRRTLVDTGLGWPNGITLDQENQALYWVDALRDRVSHAFVMVSRHISTSCFCAW